MNLSILIINYNERELTQNCLESLGRQTRKEFEIVVVENGTKEEERVPESRIMNYELKLRNEKKNRISFKHVFLNRNYGFPAGINIGAKCCSGEWVLVLNNDCELKENFMEILDSRFSHFAYGYVGDRRENDKYQIYSPKIYQASLDSRLRGNDNERCGNDKVEGGDDRRIKEKNMPVIYACGDKIDEKGLAGNIGRGEVDRGQYDNVKEIPLATFACILIKKELLERFPLNEDYFGYYEDVDFCLRVRKAGYKIGFLPEAVCFHRGEASFKKFNRIDNEIRQFRNLSFTVIQNFPLTQIVRHYLLFNLKSFRYYFCMKKKLKFIFVELQIAMRLLSKIINKLIK